MTLALRISPSIHHAFHAVIDNHKLRSLDKRPHMHAGAGAGELTSGVGILWTIGVVVRAKNAATGEALPGDTSKIIIRLNIVNRPAMNTEIPNTMVGLFCLESRRLRAREAAGHIS